MNFKAFKEELERLRAENEKFRQANDEKNEFLEKLGISATGEFHRIKHYIDKLIAENEELKEYIKKDLAPHAKMLQNLSDRYKQALEEIKGIIKYQILNDNCPTVIYHHGDCSHCRKRDFCHKGTILNKINEVLKDE